ncbi:MAG: hypothetical protein RIQ88_558 [Actinomycetota bacterium]
MFRRIFIVGTSGSGKSTLAKELADAIGYDHVEIDALYWLPNWTKREKAEFDRLYQQAMKSSGVISDGNFLTHGVTLGQGDCLIWLDLGRLTISRRILLRSVKRVVTREKLWSGNQEQVRFLFSFNPELNPVLWSWKSYERRKKEYAALINSVSDATVYRIQNKTDLAECKLELVSVQSS